MNVRFLSRFVPLLVVFVVVAPGAAKLTSDRHVARTAPHLALASAGIRPLNADRRELVQDRASRAGEAVRTREVRPAPGNLTGWWGESRPGHMHTGIDIDGDTGDPVVAAAGGTVVHAGPAVKGYSGYGDMVTIDHGAFQTVYAHLSRVDVAVGQVVDPGTLIGAIGTTGSVTGSHLHFETRVDGKPVDPKSLMHIFD
ncbi:MAG: M23 family metallopeptidase [Actinobacteria bacterium]|nr:M23 family metallopeptidase [Actinomycetota bacterium]